jgi:hypothetical protein
MDPIVPSDNWRSDETSRQVNVERINQILLQSPNRFGANRSAVDIEQQIREKSASKAHYVETIAKLVQACRNAAQQQQRITNVSHMQDVTAMHGVQQQLVSLAKVNAKSSPQLQCVNAANMETYYTITSVISIGPKENR